MHDHHLTERTAVSHSRALITLVRQHEAGVTRQHLAEKLDLPPTTLSRLLDRLLKKGLIEESGLADSSGGRRPNLYSMAREGKYLFGLDLSGMRSRLVLTDLNLTLLAQYRLPGIGSLLADPAATPILSACTSLLDQLHLSADQVLGCGIGWAGIQQGESEQAGQPDFEEYGDHAGGTLPDPARQLAAAIQACGNFPVQHLRGADAALYAGLWLDRSLAEKTLLYLSAGLTIRLGIAWSGQFHQSSLATDAIDALLVPSPTGQGTIPLSQIASRPALLRRFQKMKQKGVVNWEDFCQAAGQGKKKARQVLDPASESLAVTIMNSAILTSADYLLLGGPLFSDLPLYQEMLLRKIEAMLPDTGRSLHILANPYDDAIVAVGSAAYMLEQIIQDKRQV